MKELIDYFNEKYTKKKEYICKDLKPIKLLNDDEYMDFRDDAGLINPQEINYYPLFKVPKIKNNRPMSIGYILKTNIVEYKEYKGIIKQSVIDGHKENCYDDNYIIIVINGDEIALETYDISINENNCSLTLYIDSPELPKLEYPKNKMDMYRAISFIGAISIQVQDSYLTRLIMETFSLLVRNIENVDEMNFILDLGIIPSNIFSQKNSYFLTKKDNYYTVLDAIKKGKFIYIDSDNILPYWMINKEEKKIILKSFELDISAEASENGVLIGQMPR